MYAPDIWPDRLVKSHQTVPTGKPRRKPSSLFTLIKEELDQVSNETPQSSGLNIDAFLHGNLSSLNAIRMDIRWSLGLDDNSIDKRDFRRLEVLFILSLLSIAYSSHLSKSPSMDDPSSKSLQRRHHSPQNSK
jgi:hypothetical protein